MSSLYLQSMGQKVKEIIISELRLYFQNVSQFGFPGSNVQMPIIREAYGIDLRSYPAVFVKILSANAQPLGIGQDFVQTVFSDDQHVGQKYLPHTENFITPVPYRNRAIALRYGYMMDISFNLEVWADRTPVRNRIVDEIVSAFRHYQREHLLEQGIVLISLNEGAESDFPLNDTEMVFIANINLNVNAELYFDERVASVTAVSARVNKNITTSPDQPSYIDEEIV